MELYKKWHSQITWPRLNLDDTRTDHKILRLFAARVPGSDCRRNMTHFCRFIEKRNSTVTSMGKAKKARFIKLLNGWVSSENCCIQKACCGKRIATPREWKKRNKNRSLALFSYSRSYNGRNFSLTESHTKTFRCPLSYAVEKMHSGP